MRIAGLQKLTLLDFPGHVSCIVFTAGCNFACPFCHNSDLVCDSGNIQLIDESEVLAFLSKRGKMLEGVCISGGEPLLQHDLAEFLKKVRGLGLKVKLDTNGFFPEKLQSLLERGLLDYVAMDVKNSAEKYAVTAGLTDKKSGVDCYQAVLKSAHIIMNSGVDYELRTTLVKDLHTPADLISIGRDFSSAKRFFLQSFKDSGRVLKSGLSPFEDSEMLQMLEALKKHIPTAKIR